MLDMPISMVHKVLRNILCCYLYTITHVQQLLPADLAIRELFALQFLAQMEVDNDTLWSDEAHFHLQDSVKSKIAGYGSLRIYFSYSHYLSTLKRLPCGAE
ncbi:hypothetical protein X975_23761, partial [Stegodyphus mimosarum]